MSEKLFARVPFTYAHRNLDRGELCDLKGTPRDAQLVGLKYFVIFDPAIYHRVTCDSCGRAFASDGFLDGHKRKKGGCLANTQEITAKETAELADKDPEKFKVVDPEDYHVPDDPTLIEGRARG